MAGPTMQKVSTLVSKDISNYLINQQTWGGIIYNVKAFGAKGDGTTDDTAAIQSTINAVNTVGGGVVYFPSGTYMISGVLILPGNDISLMSFDYGNAIIKLKNNASPIPFSLIVAEGAIKTNISIIGLTIDGNRDNNVDQGTPDVNGNQDPFWAGTLLAIINLTNVDVYQIKDCTIVNSWGSAMWINDCQSGLVENNRCDNYRSVGIAIRNNTAVSNDPIFSRVIGNECSGGVVGLHVIFGGRHITMADNVLHQNTDQNRFPAIGYGGTYPNVYPLTGGFNTPSDPGYVSPALPGDGAGIELTGVYTSGLAIRNQYVTITGNVCRENQNGIRSEEESQYITITGNTCSENFTHGIFIFSSRFNTISGNNCGGNGMDGIHCEKLANSVIPGAVGADENNITGNTCTNNARWGCFIGGLRGAVVSSNNLSDNNTDTALTGGGLMLMFGPDSIEVSRAIITDNLFISYNSLDKYGIFSDSASNVNNLVTGNIFQGQLTAAISGLALGSNMVNNNIGYLTSNWGITNIASGASSVVVNHGLPFAPFDGQLQVTPVNDVGVGIRWWADTIGVTSFTIRTSANVGADTFFNWAVIEDKP